MTKLKKQLPFLFILVLIFVVFRFGIGVQFVSGQSMMPTLEDGAILLISKSIFTPERGDIVVVETSSGTSLVKRIVGLPNETIEIVHGQVYINGQPWEEPYTQGTSPDMSSVQLGDQEYFVMGDNRTLGESLDSRNSSIGPIQRNNIVGESIFTIFPFFK